MAGHTASRDLLAGGAAVAVLLLVIAVGPVRWMAIPLAVATYTGMVWLWPHRDSSGPTDEVHAQRVALRQAVANARAIRSLQPQIANPVTREQVGRICDRIDQVLAVIEEDGAWPAAPVFNEHLLVPLRALLAEYVRLANRGIGSAGDLLEKTEARDLPRVEGAIDDFYERLHRSHVIDLATIGDVLDINLETINTAPSRRLTR